MPRPELTVWSSRSLIVFCIAALMALTVPVHASDESGAIFGLWHTPKNDGRVEIAPCGDAVCARIVDGAPLRANPDQRDVLNPKPELRSRRVKGLVILDGYAGGPYEWRGGSVYDPQTGDASWSSTLQFLPPRTLVVRGCHLIFCREETWTKLSSAAPSFRENP